MAFMLLFLNGGQFFILKGPFRNRFGNRDTNAPAQAYNPEIHIPCAFAQAKTMINAYKINEDKKRRGR
ncbi:hypothetical protein AB5I83_12750 [Mesobacillus sp. LC4]